MARLPSRIPHSCHRKSAPQVHLRPKVLIATTGSRWFGPRIKRMTGGEMPEGEPRTVVPQGAEACPRAAL